jgi:hypothetical protein
MKAKMKTKSFCVFIISHGRADNVITKRTLERSGYTGPIFIVIDNEDAQAGKYKANFGSENVVIFDKLKYAQMVDSCDNFQNRRTTTHARNACFDIAEEKGFEYFLVLDDDYTSFCHVKEGAKNTTDNKVRTMDRLALKVAEFLDSDARLMTICFLQSGDTIGGMVNYEVNNMRFPFAKRKAMNSFFCKTSRRFWFFSRLNEDVNTYLCYGVKGDLFMTIPQILLQQKQSQSNTGGMSDAYIASGTYVKSFYTVMICPSFAKVTITPAMKRLHHKISWNNAVPKIIDECYKKL